MSDNEDMVATSDLDATDEIIDLDDVEGHGLREVAAGLGAAAVLAGGGAAAAATIGVHPSTGGPSVPTVKSVVDASDRLVDGGVNSVRATRDTTVEQAGSAVDGAAGTAGRVATGAQSTTQAMAGAAGSIARAELAAADRIKDGAAATATTVAGASVRYAAGTAGSAATTATGTAGSTAASAEGTADSTVRKVATLTQVTVQEAGALVTSLRIEVGDMTPAAGAGASAQGGFVTLDLGGSTLMRVELHDGQASVELSTKDLLGKVLTATYSGDSMHASSSRTLAF